MVLGEELASLKEDFDRKFSPAEMLEWVSGERPDPETHHEDDVRRLGNPEKLYKLNPSLVQNEIEWMRAEDKLVIACSTGGGAVAVPKASTGLNKGDTTATPKKPKPSTTTDAPGDTGCVLSSCSRPFRLGFLGQVCTVLGRVSVAGVSGVIS